MHECRVDGQVVADWKNRKRNWFDWNVSAVEWAQILNFDFCLIPFVGRPHLKRLRKQYRRWVNIFVEHFFPMSSIGKHAVPQPKPSTAHRIATQSLAWIHTEHSSCHCVIYCYFNWGIFRDGRCKQNIRIETVGRMCRLGRCVAQRPSNRMAENENEFFARAIC